MKILQVIPGFFFGGAETMCENLTYALAAAGHSVWVVSLYDEHTPISDRMEAAGVRILYLDKKLGLDVSMVPKLMKIMKEIRPDVVHTHLDVIKYATLAAKLAGVKKCVHTVHNVADKEAEGSAQKLINRTYFTLGWSTPVALSPLVHESILSFYGLDAQKVPMVYNGIDLSRCIPKTSWSSEKLSLVHVGRFNEQKNHEGLLRAFQIVHGMHPNCQLNLLGDGELRPQMEHLAGELGIRDAVRFLGNRSDVYPYLHEADIFLLPSKYEGMPMTIIEAMGTGLPVVASAVGGVPDMIRQEVSGLLVSCVPQEIAEAVLRLVECETLRQTLGENARKDCCKFSAEYMAEQYLKIYNA